jgi:hypothetical protein
LAGTTNGNRHPGDVDAKAEVDGRCAGACTPPSRGVGVMTVGAWGNGATTPRFPRRTCHRERGGVVAAQVEGKKVAILAADGVERVEYEQPRQR